MPGFDQLGECPSTSGMGQLVMMNTICSSFRPWLYLLYAPFLCETTHGISIASDEYPVWQGHTKEAKRGPPGGPRITRTS